jgi:hypothetical protein
VKNQVNGIQGEFDPVAFAMQHGDGKYPNAIGNSSFEKENLKHADSFYVRLQPGLLYFTETTADTNVLAAISFDLVKDSAKLGFPNCFEVSKGPEFWMFCAET